MIIQESKLINEVYVDGYYLILKNLEELVRAFQADCHDGFISNDGAYIEQWLKKHNIFFLLSYKKMFIKK